jgi:hypothetical protein
VLTLPALFEATLVASGELRSPPVAFTLALDGTASRTLTAVLTTGLTADGALEGAPLAADGRFRLVGHDAVAGQAMRLDCQAVPAPDLDQLPLGAQVTRVAGVLATRCQDGSCTERDTLCAILSGTDAGFTSAPATVRISSGDATIATAYFPGGLEPRGSGFTATNVAGTTVDLRRLQPKGAPRYRVEVTNLEHAPAFDTLPASGSLQITADIGGLVGRSTVTFRQRRAGAGRRVRF